jgi:hypothetical protein
MAAILNSRQPVTPFARPRRLSSHSILTRLANFPHNLYCQLPPISSFPLHRCVLHWEAVKALPRVYQAKGTNSADSQLLASCPGCNGDTENTEWEGYNWHGIKAWGTRELPLAICPCRISRAYRGLKAQLVASGTAEVGFASIASIHPSRAAISVVTASWNITNALGGQLKQGRESARHSTEHRYADVSTNSRLKSPDS